MQIVLLYFNDCWNVVFAMVQFNGVGFFLVFVFVFSNLSAILSVDRGILYGLELQILSPSLSLQMATYVQYALKKSYPEIHNRIGNIKMNNLC